MSSNGDATKHESQVNNDEYEEADETSAALIPETKTRCTRVSAAKTIITGGIRHAGQQRGYSQSCPIQIPDSNGLGTRTVVYGSVPNTTTDSSQSPIQHVIYCIHGKPNGSCVLSHSDLVDRPLNGSTTQGNRRKDSLTATIVGDHCHQVLPNTVDKKARRKLILASVLCVLFMIGEIVGGILSSSLAIATDAAHLLTDFASFMISLFALWVASRPATRMMSFGWHRAEVIGALTSVLMIWVVTGILVYLAVERVITRDFEIDSTPMLITSALGILVNLIMGLTLHQHGHSHGVSDSEVGHGNHQHEDKNLNVRAAFIHVVGDFIQSFGVFVAALIIYFKPTWILVDPICTFLFSILVLITTFAIIKETMLVLMEGMPKGMDFTRVMNTFLKIDGVVRVHNLRIWALSMNKTALAAHLAIAPGVSPQEVLQKASHDIRTNFNFFEMTLQIEEFDQNMEDCDQCRCPDS